jgi:hypothetical protein
MRFTFMVRRTNKMNKPFFKRGVSKLRCKSMNRGTFLPASDLKFLKVIGLIEKHREFVASLRTRVIFCPVTIEVSNWSNIS